MKVKKKKKYQPAKLKAIQRQFLDLLMERRFCVQAVVRELDLGQNILYQWKTNDPEFALAYEDTKEEYIQALEAEADRRAAAGCKRRVYFKGIAVGTYREYSDALLMFRLKALRPETYRERSEVKSDSVVEVIADPDWYGNSAHDKVAQGAPAPGTDPAEQASVQDGGVRAPVGKKRDGANGSRKRPRT